MIPIVLNQDVVRRINHRSSHGAVRLALVTKINCLAYSQYVAGYFCDQSQPWRAMGRHIGGSSCNILVKPLATSQTAL